MKLSYVLLIATATLAFVQADEPARNFRGWNQQKPTWAEWKRKYNIGNSVEKAEMEATLQEALHAKMEAADHEAAATTMDRLPDPKRAREDRVVTRRRPGEMEAVDHEAAATTMDRLPDPKRAREDRVVTRRRPGEMEAADHEAAATTMDRLPDPKRAREDRVVTRRRPGEMEAADHEAAATTMDRLPDPKRAREDRVVTRRRPGEMEAARLPNLTPDMLREAFQRAKLRRPGAQMETETENQDMGYVPSSMNRAIAAKFTERARKSRGSMKMKTAHHAQRNSEGEPEHHAVQLEAHHRVAGTATQDHAKVKIDEAKFELPEDVQKMLNTMSSDRAESIRAMAPVKKTDHAKVKIEEAKFELPEDVQKMLNTMSSDRAESIRAMAPVKKTDPKNLKARAQEGRNVHL